MILTDKEKMILTPTYHVFEMYIPFQGATSAPVQIEAPEYKHGEWSMPSVDVSAARSPDGKLYVALLNLDPNNRAIVSARISGINARSAQGRVLTAPTIDAHNTFEHPDAVQPAPYKATRRGDALRFELPPKSVVVVAVTE
jgi:alpha-N-arabinofuranosidase